MALADQYIWRACVAALEGYNTREEERSPIEHLLSFHRKGNLMAPHVFYCIMKKRFTLASKQVAVWTVWITSSPVLNYNFNHKVQHDLKIQLP